MFEFGAPIGPGSEGYLKLLLHSSAITEPKIKWVFILDPLTDTDAVMETLKPFSGKYRIIESLNLPTDINYKTYRYTSLRHGAMLDALWMAAESEITGVFDLDVAFLCQGWAQTMSAQINGDTIACGSEPVIDDLWRGYPSSMACVFSKQKFLEIGASYDRTTDPEKMGGKWIDVTDENNSIWNKPVGSKVYMETGYRIPREMAKHGYKTVLLDSMRTKDPQFEFYSFKGKKMISHMTMSRQRTYDDHIHSKTWLKMVREEALLNGVNLDI